VRGRWTPGGREALLRYVPRPPMLQERLEPRPDGLVRITLKKAYTDGTVAVDMDPLSLLCRLATSVSPTERGRPADTARGRSFWRAPSPWTSCAVPPARDACGCSR